LLHTALGAYLPLAKLQNAVAAIAVMAPPGKLREVLPYLGQHLVSVDVVEGVGEVNFQEDMVGCVSVALRPLSFRVDGALGHATPTCSGHK